MVFQCWSLEAAFSGGDEMCFGFLFIRKKKEFH